jgi:hypothetical protein
MATDSSQPTFGITRIVEELRDLHSRRLTGTYYVVSEENRQVRIGLVDGEIESITYRGLEGARALAGLAAIRAARTRFSADSMRSDASAAVVNLPTTEALLKALLHGGITAPPPVRVADAAAAGSRLVAKLTTAEQQWIRDALTDYLGPIAGLVYDENRDPNLAVETMLAQLAEEIPGSERAAEFLAKVHRGLYKSG